MLTLQLMSDLHLEQHRDGGFTFLHSLDPSGVDVLVLAGDIVSARFPTQVRQQFEQLVAKYPKVFYVPGNHELWGSTADQALTGLRSAISHLPNVVLFDNQVITYKGHRFLGGPMWFPQWSPLYDYASTQMNDFEMVPEFRTWAPQANTKFREFLSRELKTGDVVLTHYLPSMKCVAPPYKGSQTNPFFVSEMDDLILDRAPALWLHGHTHESVDVQLGRTRIVCNPFGYPRILNPKYIEKLLIVVE